MSGKRPRQISLSIHEFTPQDAAAPVKSDTDLPAVDSKLPRTPQSPAARSLICSLPPSCGPPRHPTKLGSLRELESHYAKYHTHICQEGACHQEPGGAKIFPDARLLELHQAEYHNEIIALKSERGEKTFACFLESCPRKFRSPKGRRLHLISVHGYPKLYFFAVTKHGIGRLLERYGEGATLIRKEWKPRAQGSKNTPGDPNSDSDDGDLPDSDHPPADATNAEPKIAKDETTAPNATPSSVSQAAPAADDVDDLASTMKSLSLIPTSIRFGRGARRAGFVRAGAVRGGISSVTPHTSSLRNRGE